MDYLVAAGIVVKDSADVYDRMADVYDDRYSDASCAEENAIVADMVRRLLMDCDQPVLDVGCGTGLALELGLIRPENYVGLDPSEGMLKRFLDKFPDLEDALFHDTFEGYRKRTTRYTRYAAIISLFGSPSYIDPVYIHHLFSMAPKVLLMHYVQGYWPDYEGMPLNSNASRKAAAMACEARGGVTIRLNNFQITKVG
jgi:SAM-dependent methyltransferase